MMVAARMEEWIGSLWIKTRSSLYEGAFLFFVRRSKLALNTGAKSCAGRFGVVHSRFCCAAADLALNRAANFDCSFTRAL